MKDRLLKVMKHLNLTAARFADEIGVQRSGISHILSGRNQPSFDFIVKIMKRYPELNLDWLIMGKGDMLRLVAAERTIKQQPGLFDELESKPEPPAPEMNTISKDGTGIPVESEVTNVNHPEQIVIFYENGTFKPYLPVSNE
jgi:transcriptional regulator with XRE-family HTH domain